MNRERSRGDSRNAKKNEADIIKPGRRHLNKMLLPESSSSWVWPLLAAIGGLFVFVGLWMEKGVERESLNINDFRWQKSKAKWGWRVLMFGIALEIIIGFMLSRKEEINEVKNNPRNQQIQSISAQAYFFVSGTNLAIPLQSAYSGMYSFATTGLDSTELSGFTREVAQNSLTRRSAFALVASKLVVEPIETNVLLLKLDFEGSPFPTSRRYSALAGELYTWDVLLLSVPFLGPNRELKGSVTSGEIIVRVNWLSRTYKIPKQKSHFAARTLSLIATNGQFLPYDFWRLPNP